MVRDLCPRGVDVELLLDGGHRPTPIWSVGGGRTRSPSGAALRGVGAPAGEVARWRVPVERRNGRGVQGT